MLAPSAGLRVSRHQGCASFRLTPHLSVGVMDSPCPRRAGALRSRRHGGFPAAAVAGAEAQLAVARLRIQGQQE